MLMEDLVFGFYFAPSEVEAMTVKRLHWWHRRAHAYLKRTRAPDRK